MKNNNQKMSVALLIGSLLFSCIENQGTVNREMPGMQVEVLEYWITDEKANVALLVLDTTEFNREAALRAAGELCGKECDRAYFYTSEEAYRLHAYNRTHYSDPDVHFGGDAVKMLRAEKDWKEQDGHWKTVRDNLLATVSSGEYKPYPHKGK